MKKAIVGITMITIMWLSNAQTNDQAKNNNELLEAINRDFPELVIKEQTVLPITYRSDVATRARPSDKLGTNRANDEQDGYNVFIEGEKRVVSANYSNDYRLLWAIVQRKNVTPNAKVRDSLFAAYPGWTISKNSYRMLRNENGHIKEMYKHILTKDQQKITVKTDGKGTILDSSKKKGQLAMTQRG